VLLLDAVDLLAQGVDRPGGGTDAGDERADVGREGDPDEGGQD